jgi:hypothetical protein
MHARTLSSDLRIILSVIVALACLVQTGCDLDPFGEADSASRLVSDTTTGPIDVPPPQGLVNEAASDNDSFAAAQGATMVPGGAITIDGRIDFSGDVDVYALGPAAAGDLVTIEVTGRDGLNTVAALFERSGDLIDANDDRSYYGGRLDPFISARISAATDNLLLGIAVSQAAYFASTEGRYDSGSYSVRVTHVGGGSATPPRVQYVWLDFEGGEEVQIGGEQIELMRRFNVESISTRLAGQTDYVIGLILQHMAHDYAGYDVVLLNSKQHSPPLEPHSQVFFGNFHSAFLGLADNVDAGNLNHQQEAIVYAEDIRLFESLRPSAEEVAQALANIGSHELGHLLGLEHTRDPEDLMATAATARQVLEVDASFVRASLSTGVFPIGFQNNPVVLMQNVGGPGVPEGSARQRLRDVLPVQQDTSFRDAIDLSELPVFRCGRCERAHAEIHDVGL